MPLTKLFGLRLAQVPDMTFRVFRTLLISLILLSFSASAQSQKNKAPRREENSPTIQEVHAAALRYLGFNESEMSDWKKKARISALLPTLQAGFSRDLKGLTSLTTKDSVSISGGDIFVGPAENNFDRNYNQGTAFDVKAVWYLNEILFNRDSLSVSSERREWTRERNKILEQVSDAYFTRRRLVGELRTSREPAEIKDKKKLLIDQALGRLDALTGGWYSSQLKKGD